MLSPSTAAAYTLIFSLSVNSVWGTHLLKSLVEDPAIVKVLIALTPKSQLPQESSSLAK